MIHDILDFIRFRICITILFISASGYLLFNPVELNLALVVLSSFFVFAGGYAYNNITDRAEDRVNRGKVNTFVNSNKNYIIVSLFFATGFLFSLFLTFYLVVFFLIILGANIFYSLLRIKKHVLIKNLYTAFGISLAFLYGALAVSSFTNEIIVYYFMMSFFIFIGSVISDLRDYEGDRKIDINTLPVAFGFQRTKNSIYILLAMFSFLVLLFQKFIVLLPFVLVTIFFLQKNRASSAHSTGGFSLMILTIWLLL